METNLTFKIVGNYSISQTDWKSGEDRPREDCNICHNAKYATILVKQEDNYVCVECLISELQSTKKRIEELEKSKLTKEEFYAIACEYRPSIAEDSQQPEWTVGELNKLWIGLTKGHWLYINREIKCEKELQMYKDSNFKWKNEYECLKEKLTVENVDKFLDLKLRQLLIDNSPDEKGYTKSNTIAQALIKYLTGKK